MGATLNLLPFSLVKKKKHIELKPPPPSFLLTFSKGMDIKDLIEIVILRYDN